MQFQKGASGNPGGRRKKTTDDIELEKAAKGHTEAALAALVKVATKGKSESAKVAAATALLDRGWGKPKQTVDTTLTLTHEDELDALDRDPPPTEG